MRAIEFIIEGKRIPRKKGQPANSKKHSDLYTDENPKGTIHGLKFATVKDAEASVNKIKSSGKAHAHKIQAAVAMEQRAKAAGKKSAAAVYRRYINQMKKKTKKNETKEAPPGTYFTKSGNLVKGRLTKDAKSKGARKTDPLDKQRSKVPSVSQYNENQQFRVTKQTNGFTVDLYVDSKHAGQYTHTRNEDNVRNFAEIFPEFRNKGHGGMLLLKAIGTADKLGMDFEEDSHSLTPAMSRLYDQLDSEGLIYGGNGVWAISPTGEDALDEYLNENFADGKKKGKSRPGRVKKAGASCKGSVTHLRKMAKKYSGERGKMYHWCANMKAGRNK